MREAFQILDRDSDGVVSREDVMDMLNQLGKMN
jgi:Ca2+-binding EF-hand superfamily protein